MLDLQRLKEIKESLRMNEAVVGGRSIAVEQCHELLTHINTLTARVAALEDALVGEMAQRLYYTSYEVEYQWDCISDQKYWLDKARKELSTTYPTKEEG